MITNYKINKNYGKITTTLGYFTGNKGGMN